MTQKEAEEFYRTSGTAEERPVMRGLNSTLVKRDGMVEEDVWKVSGKYGAELKRVAGWLEKALPYAADEQQKKVVRLLIDYYHSGDLRISTSIRRVAKGTGRSGGFYQRVYRSVRRSVRV